MGAILSLRHYRHDLVSHRHEHHQLVFGLSGHLDFEVEGHGSQISHQQLIVIPGGAHHACASPAGSHCLVMDVPGADWLHNALGEHAQASHRLLESPEHLQLNPSQSQLVNWLASSPIDDALIARQGAILLLASLNQRPHSLGSQRRLPLAAFDAHIDQHAAYPLQVADLARLAGLSSARLHARFIAECGKTPMDYIRERRLQRALTLLRETSLPMSEIASHVGYSSQSAFSAAMLRAFGATPGQLRREPDDKSR